MRTQEEIKDFFEKEDIELRIPDLMAESCFEVLSKRILNNFDARDPVKVQNLYFMLEKTMLINDKNVLDKVLENLTGMKSVDLIGMPYIDIENTIDINESEIDIEEKIESANQEQEELENEDQEELGNDDQEEINNDEQEEINNDEQENIESFIPDEIMTENSTIQENALLPVERKKFSFSQYAINSYMRKAAILRSRAEDDLIKGRSSFRRYGREAIGYTLTTAKVATVGTAVFSYKLAKIGVKAFKAAKGSLEKVMREKENKDLLKANNALIENDKHLSDFSKENMKSLEQIIEKFEKYGFGKTSKALEAYEILKGAEGNREDIKQEAEGVIAEGYFDASTKRDECIAMMVNNRIITALSDAFGITPKEALEYVSQMSLDKNENIIYPESDTIPRDKIVKALFHKGIDLRATKNAIKRNARIDKISEEDKADIFKYIEYDPTRKALSLQSDINMEELSPNVRFLVRNLMGKSGKNISKLFRECGSYTMQIDFLAKCEAEVMARYSLESNRELEKKLMEKAATRSEHRGFIKQSVRTTQTSMLREEAEKIVKTSMSRSISETEGQYESKIKRLLEKAQDKLIGNDRSIMDALLENSREDDEIEK